MLLAVEWINCGIFMLRILRSSENAWIIATHNNVGSFQTYDIEPKFQNTYSVNLHKINLFKKPNNICF